MAGVLTATLCMSCIDNSYDLNDIDMTIGNNTNLTLPKCSTDSILLKNIMHLKQDDVIKIVPFGNGEIYVVKQDGEADIKPFKIDEISVSKPQKSTFDTKTDVSEFYTNSQKPAKRKVISVDPKVPGMAPITIPDETYVYKIDPAKANMKIDEAKANNISKDIISIDHIKCKEEITVTLHLSTDGFPEHVNKIHLDNLSIILPEEIEVTSCYFVSDGEKTNAVSIAPGHIKLIEGKDKARTPDNIQLTITFQSAHNGKNFNFDPEKHTASLGGMFEVVGEFRLMTEEMDQALMQKAIDNEIARWSEKQKIENLTKFNETHDLRIFGDAVIPSAIHFKGEAAFNKDIVVKYISGEILHNVDEIKPIKLDNLPDFLQEDEVKLDLANPMIFIRAKSNLPATATTSITLYNDINPEKKYAANDLIVNGYNKETKYYLANNKETKYLPTEDADAEFRQVENIGNLIIKVPKEVNIEVAPVRVKFEDLEIGNEHEYTVQVDYDVYAPLSFNDDFYLIYKGKDLGWNLDDDIAKINAKGITAKALISSNLPEELDFTLIPVDANNEEIKALEVSSAVVKPNAEKQPITITLKPAKGHTINDVLAGKNGVKKLDGIQYRAVIKRAEDDKKGNAGQVWQGNTNIILTDIQLTIEGPITYDAN